MSYNLRNRSFLKEIDFEPVELRFLLQALRGAQDREVRRHRGPTASTARRSPSSSRRRRPGPVRPSRSRPTTRAPTSPTSTPPARSWVTRSRSPTRPGCSGACTTPSSIRGNAQDDVEELAEHRRRPGLQRADRRVAPDADARRLPHHARGVAQARTTSSAYAFVGDCRFNMGRSLLVMGALMGADVRLVGPPELAPPADVVATAEEIAGRTGARITDHRRRRHAGRRRRRLRPHRCVGLDGRGQGRLDRAGRPAPAVPGEPSLLDATGNRKAKFMHCLPAFHDPNTVVGREIMEHTDMPHGPRGHRRGLRVRGEHRVRPGGEPPPHHQGHPRRDARPEPPTSSAHRRTPTDRAVPDAALTTRQAAFIGVGSMVGAGIFSLLGAPGRSRARRCGSRSCIAGIVAMLQGYSFAKFGARFPSAGGLLEYVGRGFGDGHLAGILAWLLLAANAIVTAMVAVSFGSYASSAFTDGSDELGDALRRPPRRWP